MSEYVTPLVVGVLGLSFLLLYFMNSLDSEKPMMWVLKLIILFFVASMVLLVPKAVSDGVNVCETVVSNSTVLSASVTSYEYAAFCYDRPEGTTVSFLKTTQLLYYLLLGFTIVYVGIWGVLSLYDAVKRRRS